MSARKPVQTTSVSRPAFTNDFDHSSEPSREGSVQIVKSNRHTFSVPSSDDEIDSEDEEDEVQVSSSIHGDEEISAATTPDRQAVGKAYNNTEGHLKGCKTELASVETRGSNLKGPSLRDLLIETEKDGTSQENPIDLEGVSTDSVVVDTESEDEGPDVLPIHESSKNDQPNPPRVLDQPQVFCQASAVVIPKMTLVAEKTTDQDSELHRHSTIPETQAKEPNVREHQPTSAHTEPTSGATDDFDSEDDDAFDYDPEFLADEDLEQQLPNTPAFDGNSPTYCKPKVTFQVGNDRPRYTTLTPPFDEFLPTRRGHLSASDAIDVSQSTGPSSSWTRRAPSPSDAALARKVNDSKTSFNRDILDGCDEPRWPAAAKVTHYSTVEQMFDNASLHQETASPYIWSELQPPEPRLYDEGPFSSQPRDIVPGPRSPKPENSKNQVRKTTVGWAEPHEDNYDIIMNGDSFARTGRRASKITIPSLVENYLAENPRAVKRKYGGMNGNKDVESASKEPKPKSSMARTSGYKRTFEEANATPSSCPYEASLWQSGEDNTTKRHTGPDDPDTPLPDAQPRENILQTFTISPSQDSVAEPAVNSVAISTRIQDHDAEGPARKKARTSSSSSSRGIGKFVLGVGFGLLGAAAAFVATIPASVYEEALREFGNAA